jgi:hypothetical protein
MSRTKEIEVWVTDNVSDVNMSQLITRNKFSSDQYSIGGVPCVKAKLIIELPERKVEITESQFDEAWLKAVGTTYDRDRIDLKKELFGEQP